MRRAAAVIVVIAAVLVWAPAAEPAPQATVAGTLSGAKLPAAGAGRVPVWAMRLTDGVVAAATRAKPSGRVTLKLPAGPYAILATVVRRRGRASAAPRVVDFVTAKARRRTAIRPTLKPRRRVPARRARASEHVQRATFVQVDHPAIWVQRWRVSGGRDLAFLELGMQSMMTTDLVAEFARLKCDAVIVEREHLADILREIALQQSPYFDPATRVRTGKLIAHNATVTGSLSVAGGQMTMTATYTDQRTGRRASVSVTGRDTDLFSLSPQLAAKLAKAICIRTPRTYSGTFSGTWTSDLNDYRVTWTGDAVLDLVTRNGPPPDGAPPGSYAGYSLRSGRVHAVLSGTRGVCTVQGEADLVLAGAGPGVEVAFVQTGVDRPAFTLALSAHPADEIPYTETGAGCNQVDPRYPLTSVSFIRTDTPLEATDVLNLTGNESRDDFGTSHFTTAFTFAGT